jgi:hypothetical protein
MKAFVMFRLPLVALLFGAAVVLSPNCKAQSEVNPDHFEGGNTEPFEKVSAPAIQQARTLNRKTVTSSARTTQTKPAQSVQLTDVRDTSKPSTQEAVATGKKRKVTRKPKQ